MPTYYLTWTATVRGHTRIDADDPEKAEQLFLDSEPDLTSDIALREVAVVHVDESDPGVTLP